MGFFSRLRGRLPESAHYQATEFGNVLPQEVNQRYVQYARECRQQCQGTSDVEPPFLHFDPIIVREALPRDFALACSARITEQIAAGSVRADAKHPFLYRIPLPLELFGERILEVFDGPLGETIKRVYQSDFRVQWFDCYRSTPGEPSGAWLWHIDNHPPFVIKALIYLTEGNARNGVTRFIDAKATQALKQLGYYGISSRDRVADFSGRRWGTAAANAEITPSLEPGDAVLFSANLLHKGGSVATGFRDVMSTLIVPGSVDWRSVHAERGAAAIQAAGGFPEYP